MRLYFFGNMYLASIQQGIQSMHCVSEMFLKYLPHMEEDTNDLYLWAHNHKTTVLLNGGESEDLLVIRHLLSNKDNPYVWAGWNESEEALNASATCVGIVLPKRIYESALELRRPPRYRDTSKIAHDLTPWEQELIEIMNGCQLAR